MFNAEEIKQLEKAVDLQINALQQCADAKYTKAILNYRALQDKLNMMSAELAEPSFKSAYNNTLTIKKIKQVVELYKNGTSVGRIGRELQMGATTVDSLLKIYGKK